MVPVTIVWYVTLPYLGRSSYVRRQNDRADLRSSSCDMVMGPRSPNFPRNPDIPFDVCGVRAWTVRGRCPLRISRRLTLVPWEEVSSITVVCRKIAIVFDLFQDEGCFLFVCVLGLGLCFRPGFQACFRVSE